MLPLVEHFERILAVQAEHGRQRDDAFNERRDYSARVFYRLVPGETRPTRTPPSKDQKSANLFDMVLVAVGSKLV